MLVVQIGVSDGGMGELLALCYLVVGAILYILVVITLILHVALSRAGEIEPEPNETSDGRVYRCLGEESRLTAGKPPATTAPEQDGGDEGTA